MERSCKDCARESDYEASSVTMLCGNCEQVELEKQLNTEFKTLGFKFGRSNQITYGHLLVVSLTGEPLAIVGGNFDCLNSTHVNPVIRAEVRLGAPEGAELFALGFTSKNRQEILERIKHAIKTGKNQRIFAPVV